MKTLAIIAVIICCVLMFFLKREYKASIMIMGTILFTLVSVPIVPLHNANILLPLCFLISEMQNISILIQSAKRSVVWKLLGLSLMSAVLTIFFSAHLHEINSVCLFLQTELFFKYFALLYAFWAYSSDESIMPTLKVTFYAMIVLTLFGIMNYITKTAEFVSALTTGIERTGISESGVDAGKYFLNSERFRVQSLFLNPFDYGYICVLMFLLHLYGYINKYERKIVFVIVALCCIFGIVSCGCRTNIFCWLVGFSVYFLLAYRLEKTIRLSFIIILSFALVYIFVPFAQDVVNHMMTMFDKNSNVQGSSLELRSVQYAAVLFHVKNNLLFGCGYHYFLIDMGWGQGLEYLADSRLAGLEGVALAYILERGFVGLFLYFAFYLLAIFYLFKNRKIVPQTCALGIAVLCVYLSFANMTGNLLSVYPTLLLLGYVFKVVDCKKENIVNTEYNENLLEDS